MNMFLLPQVNVPILGVVENIAWFTPAELPAELVQNFWRRRREKVGLDVKFGAFGQIPLVQSIREGGDGGKPAMVSGDEITKESFLDVARNVARQTAIRNEMIEPTKIIQMQG